MRASESAGHRDPDRSYHFLYECGINVLAREADLVWQSMITEWGKSWVPPEVSNRGQ